MALLVLRKLIIQTRMHNHPVGLDIWFLVGPFVYFHTSCVRTVKALARLRTRRLAWAFAGCQCDKYHNLMSWLIFIRNLYVIAWNNKWEDGKAKRAAQFADAGYKVTSLRFHSYDINWSGIVVW